MSRRTIHFEEVGFSVTKRWKTASGERRQRTRRFYQTINPWNQKTREQIMEEEQAKADAWLAEDESDE